jgi:hypothetical protein
MHPERPRLTRGLVHTVNSFIFWKMTTDTDRTNSSKQTWPLVRERTPRWLNPLWFDNILISGHGSQKVLNAKTAWLSVCCKVTQPWLNRLVGQISNGGILRGSPVLDRLDRRGRLFLLKDQIEMGGTCSTYGKGEKYKQNINCKTWKEGTTWETSEYMRK